MALSRRDRLVGSAADDLHRFVQYSSMNHGKAESANETHIVMHTYRIEKGLTLPKPRPWFGPGGLNRLLDDCKSRLANVGTSLRCRVSSVDAMSDYFEYSRAKQPETLIDLIFSRFRAIQQQTYNLTGFAAGAVSSPSCGGVNSSSSLAVRRSRVLDFRTELSIPNSSRDAITTTILTPSVCTRQAYRIQIAPRRDAATRSSAARTATKDSAPPPAASRFFS